MAIVPTVSSSDKLWHKHRLKLDKDSSLIIALELDRSCFSHRKLDDSGT